MGLGEARHYFENEGVDVTEMTGTIEEFTVAFESESQQVNPDDISTIASVYADVVDDHESVERCEIEGLDNFGEPVAYFHIKSDWAQRFNEEDVSGNEYLRKVLQTIEHAE